MRIIKSGKPRKQKRETFKHILVKRLLGTFLVATLVVLSVTVMLMQMVLYAGYSGFYSEESYSVESLTEVYDSMVEYGFDMDSPEAMQEYYSRLKLRFMSTKYVSTAILDGETLEPIWSGEETGIAVLKRDTDEDGSYLYYELDGEVPDEYRKMYMYVTEESIWGEVGTTPEDQLLGIYIKDRGFKLGQVELTDYDKGKKVITNYDFTPEDTTGYTYVPYDENVKVMVAMLAGNEKDSALYLKMQNYIRELRNSSTRNDYRYSEYMGLWDMELMTNSEVTLPDGTSLVICKVMSVNLFELLGKYILIAYLIIYTVVMGLAAIFARMKYLKLKAGYDMEDYRITMTNTMAHDLKSPLMSISGYAENLKANINTDKKEYYADSILDNVTYMNDIIANVLELSKVEMGKVKLKKSDLAMEELITEVAQHYKDSMEEKGLQLKVEGSLNIKADKALMQQVVDNLITNAIKYSKEDSSIQVTLTKKRRKSLIRFANQSTEDIGKEAADLWKPFVKGDNSRSNKQGTGVGLAIVKNILDLHGYALRLSMQGEIFVTDIIV